MRIKITSDGTIKNTRITNEDGEKIQGITSIVLNLDASKGYITGTAFFRLPVVDLDIPVDQIDVWRNGVRP